MAEFLLELYSEEIPPQLQISARNQLRVSTERFFNEKSVKYKDIHVYSSPTRLILLIKDLPEKIKISAQEIRGPKVGSPEDILDGFTKAKNIKKNDLFIKDTDKGKFYFIKTDSRNISVEDLLRDFLPKS